MLSGAHLSERHSTGFPIIRWARAHPLQRTLKQGGGGVKITMTETVHIGDDGRNVPSLDCSQPPLKTCIGVRKTKLSRGELHRKWRCEPRCLMQVHATLGDIAFPHSPYGGTFFCFMCSRVCIDAVSGGPLRSPPDTPGGTFGALRCRMVARQQPLQRPSPERHRVCV